MKISGSSPERPTATTIHGADSRRTSKVEMEADPQDLLEAMLLIEPKSRASMTRIKQHRWVQKASRFMAADGSCVNSEKLFEALMKNTGQNAHENCR
jgi:hypothetical protein